MTKVYLVYRTGCLQNGVIDVTSRKIVMEVFTNKILAQKCADYCNKEWADGLARNANFIEERIYFYYVKTKIISKEDYGELPY